MYFMELKSSKKQTHILMEILPFFRPIFKEYIEISKSAADSMDSFNKPLNEAKKEASKAYAHYTELSAKLANAEIEAGKEGAEDEVKVNVVNIKKEQEEALHKAEALLDEVDRLTAKAGAEVNAFGLEMILDYVTLSCDKYYHEINQIISKLHGLTTKEIEEEIDIFEKIELLIEIINNEKVMRFFTQRTKSNQKTPFAI